ncbi:MAG: transglycosylase domain-containing protein [Dehalococcoidia bacterium]|nr:transglycosylase domain-containing protein [Dehalococcoidia bacterium]
MDNIYRLRRKRARKALIQRGHTMRSRLSGLLTLFLLASVLSLLAFGVISALVYRSYANGLKPPEEAIAAASVGQGRAYDRNGVFLYEYVDRYGGLRNPKPLTEISPYLIAGTIATEDSSFFGNPGVNFRGVARAAVENLTPFGPGFLEGTGGSSITQQLVKNVYIQKDDRGLAPRTVERKIKETVIALELKRKYDDYQILEWYLNQIDYANLAYGAEAAAQRYFGKSAKDLSLAEAALLAGLPQAPGIYTPAILENRERAKARQLEVLDLMIKHLDEINDIRDPADPTRTLAMLHLTAEEIEAAKADPLNYVDSIYPIAAPHFVFFVQDQVAKMCAAGLFKAPGDIPCDKVVTQGGLRITTTLDLALNGIAEQVLEEEIAANEDRYDGHDGSLVAIRPATGEILAYVGSRDFWREDIDGQVDIATSLQSHGSTMKAFTYLTAFEQGWVPSTFIKDAELLVSAGGGEQRKINNWNFSYLGDITVRKAISESVNTAAVRTVMEAGMDNMRDMAHRLGITDLRQGDCGPTITLGACEVKLVDMAYAFSVLANNGVMRGRPTAEDLPSGYRELDPASVLKIQNAEGNVIYQYSNPDQRQVVDPAYAYMVTDVLSRDAISWSRLTIDRPAAAKTGTSEEYRDNVVMGYTPDLSLGVWIGNADNSAMAQGTFSSAGAGPAWRRFMTEAHEYLQAPPRPFEKPADVVTVSCNGRDEPFKVDQTPSKPGACRAPGRSSGPTASPTPRSPVFPTRLTPSPKPSATATPTPSPRLTATPNPRKTPQTSEAPVTFPYIVREGETLEGIAARFFVTVEELMAINGLESDQILAGQAILIPLRNGDAQPGNSPPPAADTAPEAAPGERRGGRGHR